LGISEGEGIAMQLKLKRSQRSAGMLGSKVVYMLDARLELTPEEHTTAAKLGLGKLKIYDSEARKKRKEAAWDRLYSDSFLYKVGGLATAALAVMSLRVTIDSLTNGHHIECKSMDELLAADSAIRQGCETLRSYLDANVVFDGEDKIIEF
jgi:hypothetical protein